MLALVLTLTFSAPPVHLRFGTESAWTDVHFSNESGAAMRACREVEKQNAPILIACTSDALPAVKALPLDGRFFRSFDSATQTVANASNVVIVKSERLSIQPFESLQGCERFLERRAEVTKRAAGELQQQKKFLDDLAERQRADESTTCSASDAFKKKPLPKKALDRQLYNLDAQRLERDCTQARAALAVTLKRIGETNPLEHRDECVESLAMP
jgi:hypothetical protein